MAFVQCLNIVNAAGQWRLYNDSLTAIQRRLISMQRHDIAMQI